MAGENISTGEYVYLELRDRIYSGIWKANEKIPSENEISEEFGVSRNTVRNAINRLTTLGMVKTYKGKGTFIVEQNLATQIEVFIPQFFRETNDYISLMNFRIAIEAQACHLAAINATYKDIQEMEHILDDLEEHKDDFEYYSKNDFMFHLKIAEYCNNKLIYSMVQMIRILLGDVYAKFVFAYGNYESINSHRKVLECIKIADSVGARNCMRTHLQTVIDRYVLVNKIKKINLEKTNKKE